MSRKTFDDDNVAGTLVFRNGSSGRVVTISYLLEESYPGSPTTAPCWAPRPSSDLLRPA